MCKTGLVVGKDDAFALRKSSEDGVVRSDFVLELILEAASEDDNLMSSLPCADNSDELEKCAHWT